MNEAVISAIVAGAILFLGKGVEWLVTIFRSKREGKMAEQKQDVELKKQQADLDKSEADHAVALYREHVADLKKDVKGLIATLHSLEEEHMTCREDRAALRVEVKNLTERMKEVEGKLKDQ